MKILVTGGRGQLGRALVRRGVAGGYEVTAFGRTDLDICDAAAATRQLDALMPAYVINAAAYTAVDRAETERDRAFTVNATGVKILANACASRQIPMLHVSTDYVFDGTASAPYCEDALLRPLGVYGESKAAGERAAHAAGATVVRTSWLFEQDGPSFVHAIVRLATERPVLRVVSDQYGCPTWADDLANALLALTRRRDLADTYHFCNAGPTTWYGFATAIVEEARRYRSLACERIEPIATVEYPTPTRRPAYSVLDTQRIRALGIMPPRWTIGMASVVAKVC